MHSVYLHVAGGAAQSAVDSTAGEKRNQLEGVLRLGRKWLTSIETGDPRREHLIRMGILAEDLIRAADHSPAAMAMARELLCANCRRFNAAPGKCLGLPLERCSLLQSKHS